MHMAALPNPSAADTLREPSDQGFVPDPATRKASGLLSLLRARKLDRTLTSVMPARPPAMAPFPSAAINQVLGGGMPRGQLSEIVGPQSSGRTSLAWAALAAATSRGEWTALVDTFDRFDPEAGAAAGLALPQVLWVRGQALSKTASAVDPDWVPGVRSVSGPGTLLERTIDRAIKAVNLIVQSGVCTMVVLDLIDVSAVGLSRIPRSTWLRIQRIIEGSDTAVVLLASIPVARSAGGLSIALGAPPPDTAGGTGTRVQWKGAHERSRRLGGLATGLRAGSSRGLVGQLPLVVG
jgi:hypothetical protein